MLRILSGVLRLGWRGAFFGALALAVSLQVATLTLAGVNAVVGGAVAAATGMATVSQALRGEAAATKRALSATRGELDRTRAQHRRATRALRDTRGRLGRRATRAVASAPSKVVPAAGAAVVVTMTVSELAAACATADAIDEALAGADEGAPEEPDATAEGFRRFCRQNADRLAAADAEIEPLLEPFDEAGPRIWTAAANLIGQAEAAADEAARWQGEIASVPDRLCTWAPDWIC